jgi:hypothetical protein
MNPKQSPGLFFLLLCSLALVFGVGCGEGIIDASEMTSAGTGEDDTYAPIEPDPGDAPVGDSPAEDPAPEDPAPEGTPEFPPVTDQDFAAPGPFETTRDRQAGPEGAFTLHYPTDLGYEGLKHPIITWGNGTGAPTMWYSGLLDHWASHGFVVIAPNSGQTGSGEEMLAGVEWLIAESENEDSPFFDTLDTESVGATGHSQGGGGSIAAGHSPLVTCIAPINSDVPTVFGVLAGAEHNSAAGSADEAVRGYVTAWFRAHLMADDSAANLFYGDGCGICTDPDWTVERKNM